jgi:DNA-binding winged helix-turn-helix (wHTH) protein
MFGPFRFEPAEHRLLRDGQPVALPPKAFELLATLVARAGHLVTKEDLLKDLWPDTFVEEANLSYTISLLRKALADDETPYRYIQTVPRRGYRFIGHITDGALETHTSAAFRRRVGAVAIAAVVLVISAATWLANGFRRQGLSPRIVPLTTLAGYERSPTLSPDSEQVAFAWDGDKQDNVDIYVKFIGSSEVRRLTTNPDRDVHPAWSPNGRQIAFVRYTSVGARIHITSALGGPDRKVSDFPVGWGGLAWSPDGQYIAALRATRFPAPRQRAFIWYRCKPENRVS